MAFWTDDKVTELTRLVGEGLSASQIGVALGCSRNSVIGKIGRLKGRAGRLSPKSHGPATKRFGQARPTMAPRPAPPKAASPNGRRAQRALPSESRGAEGQQPQAAERPVRLQANQLTVPPITFLAAIETERCLFYASQWLDLDGPDMPVCGAERAQGVIGTRYCRRHLASERQARAA